MANASQRRNLRRSAITASGNVASVHGKSLKGGAALAQAAAATVRRQKPALTTRSSRRLFDILKASAAQKAKLLGDLFKDAATRFKQVMQKHALKGIAMYFGFNKDEVFIEHLRARVAAMELRDASFSEFHSGALGRQNAFIGILFEFTVKYGPIRRRIESLASGAMQTINKDIKLASKAGAAHVMHDANGKRVKISKPFSNLLTANAFDIDTSDGVKESLDFGPVGFNPDGQWCIPLPVEIKLPRAAGGVAGQFVEFPERIAAAIKDGKTVFAYFDASDTDALGKRVGNTAIVGQEVIDGRSMVKVALDPAKLVFNSDEIYGPMSRNQMVAQPDTDIWNPANPTALPNLKPSGKVVIGRARGQPISLDVAASAKGDGFNYWRMLVPAKRALFIDLYVAIFNVET
ncbi:hypothetical protein [Lysobacter terrae]